MQEISKKVALGTVIVIGIVVAALALWKLKLVIALIFLGFILAAAMRPSVEALQRRRLPRSVALLIHYAVIAALVTLFLWIVVPRAVDQVQNALGGSTQAQIHREATSSTSG
jgi:predicted PurR-regulated permease PerM